jgi:hypothetical protein
MTSQNVVFNPKVVERIANFSFSGNTICIDGTTGATGATAFPVFSTDQGNTDVYLVNPSTDTIAFVEWGTAGVQAAIPTAGNPANGKPILPGNSVTFTKNNATHISVITASGTVTIYAMQGNGS